MKCADPPSAESPFVYDCPVCGGRQDDPSCVALGAAGCGGTGRLELTACPLRVVPEIYWQVLELADLYEKGLPPLAGGALDQMSCFLAACRFLWAEQARIEADRERP